MNGPKHWIHFPRSGWCGVNHSAKKKWCGSVNLSAKRKKNNGGLRLQLGC